MENTLLIGLSRQTALQRELDVVANNIANINTTGFKADGAVFSRIPAGRANSEQFTAPDRRMSFVQDSMSWHDMSQGTIQQTGGPLDVAIDGEGMLVVQTRAASAIPATARCSSTTSASLSPSPATRSWATTGRSCFSPPTATSSSPRTAPSRCARASASTPIRRAASFAS